MATTALTEVTVFFPIFYTDSEGNAIMLPGTQEIINEVSPHSTDGIIIVESSCQFSQGGIVNPSPAKKFVFFVADLPAFISSYDTFIQSLGLPSGTFNSLSTHAVEYGG